MIKKIEIGRIISFTLCNCGAVEICVQGDNGDTTYNVKQESLSDYVWDTDIETLQESGIEQYPISYCCDHCVNHYGLDLCACGSGEPVGQCQEGHHGYCGKPMQIIDEYESVIAQDSIMANLPDINTENPCSDSKLAKALALESEAVNLRNSLIQELGEALDQAELLSGVEKIKNNNPSCLSVKFSTVSKANNLSASHYSPQAQKDAIMKKIEISKNLTVKDLVQKIQKMVDDRKVVFSGSQNIVSLNENTISILEDFLKKA